MRLIQHTFAFFLLTFIQSNILIAAEPIPHGQDSAPNPPRTAAEAIARMKVPEGFRVELVASEPDLVNPVAMAFDERGRIWVTESVEYPRQAPGPGRDRIKILEDTDGDGKADRFTIFAEGLNIPSGIAIGNGGVWVANSPDILFLSDTDGDGKADRREVVVTGFGRFDTHELPNSLSWGPDGKLYGWNGVFNPAHIEYRGKTYDFTCALFRIDPKTRDFDLFCEGVSNSWGVDWDGEGSAFASACVIDHLWHLAETGYYVRQAGAYPPFCEPIGSIVSHRHQKAAYCGIHYFQGNAYPEQYRNKLYMGNIHGGCVNVDSIKRNGSTYRGEPSGDFLSANDAWFMPVSQKTGPDGCLYILDWYDRYHCYQDAGRDPAGIDRLKGRLYRVRYQNAPRVVGFNLAAESVDRLIDRLDSPNGYFRDQARRLLAQRDDKSVRDKLETVIFDSNRSKIQRMNALWARIGNGALDTEIALRLLGSRDASFRAWGVRGSGNAGTVDDRVSARVGELASDASPDVRLQVAIASRKIKKLDPIAVLLDVLAHSDEDPLIPNIVWNNLHPLVDRRSGEIVARIEAMNIEKTVEVAELVPSLIERMLASADIDPALVVRLIRVLIAGENPREETAARCATILAQYVQANQKDGRSLKRWRGAIDPLAAELESRDSADLRFACSLLRASEHDAKGLERIRGYFISKKENIDRRLEALRAIVAAGDRDAIESIARILADRTAGSVEFRGRVIETLGGFDDPAVARFVLAAYSALEPELKPRVIELLTQRGSWSKELLTAIGEKKIPAEALNANQVRKLIASRDRELIKLVEEKWGVVRESRDPKREDTVNRMRKLIRTSSGDPNSGASAFKKVCAQCHAIYGEGKDVGPDLTGNGRGSFEQLLSNVFDPSLVIGASYQAVTIATKAGRVLSGLVVEEGADRIVLKIQGGDRVSIPLGDIDERKTSGLSLMPEDLEKQLSAQEIVDLFAFLCLDKPPTDPSAKKLPGAGPIKNIKNR